MSNTPKIIDLFAGVGGMSLGAARAGFEVVSAVEIDDYALQYHSVNFPNSKHIKKDVSLLTGVELLELSGLRRGEINGIIGGPPCQGFSVMGERRLSDIRNDLFVHFFRLIAESKPAFFIAENVPGILDNKYNNIRDIAFSQITKKYNMLSPIVIKANEVGAPTTRKRVFFIGYDPTRVKKSITEDDFKIGLSNPVFVREALIGLPLTIDPSWQLEENSWQRTVPLLENTEYNIKTMNKIPKGVGSQVAIENLLEKSLVSGFLGTYHSQEVATRYALLQPGQVDKISKAVKLNPDGFCPTLRAGTGKEKGSYQAVRPIHFSLPRVITPREAARLQGFPDWFLFHPTKWHSFRQIGNSVSPIVGEFILSILYSKINK